MIERYLPQVKEPNSHMKLSLVSKLLFFRLIAQTLNTFCPGDVLEVTVGIYKISICKEWLLQTEHAPAKITGDSFFIAFFDLLHNDTFLIGTSCWSNYDWCWAHSARSFWMISSSLTKCLHIRLFCTCFGISPAFSRSTPKNQSASWKKRKVSEWSNLGIKRSLPLRFAHSREPINRDGKGI